MVSWFLPASLGLDLDLDDLDAPLPFLDTLALMAIGVVEGFDWKSCRASSSRTWKKKEEANVDVLQ